MRHVRNPQMELGEIGIEDIWINLKSRDDIPALLLGLQYLYADEETRTRLFALLSDRGPTIGMPTRFAMGHRLHLRVDPTSAGIDVETSRARGREYRDRLNGGHSNGVWLRPL